MLRRPLLRRTCPAAVAEGVLRASGASASAPTEVFVRSSSWRCMDARVYACTVGANLPCAERADTSRVPPAAIAEFCRTNPEAPAIPAAVTGRATVYAWRCTAGTPSVVRQVLEPDGRGYIASV